MLDNKSNDIKAGFFVRLAAYAVDILIVSLALSTFKVQFWISAIANPNNVMVRNLMFDWSIRDIVLYCMQVLYFVLMTYKTGSTLGKKAFKLNVVSDNNEPLKLFDVIYRETIGRFLSALICCVGYFMALVRDDKKCLHDILSDTKVVYDIKPSTTSNVNEIEETEVVEPTIADEPTLNMQSEIEENTNSVEI